MKKPTTLITGAGVRVGAQLARHLAAAGHDLVLHYHNSKAEAEALGAELTQTHGTQVTFRQANLEQLPKDFWQGLPPVTHLIHNAARFVRDQLPNMAAETLRMHLATNLEAPLLLTQGYLAQLPAEVSGCVIVLGDGNKRWSLSPEFFSYAISKLAWESVIDLLAAALAPRARANVIAMPPLLPGMGESDAMYGRLRRQSPLKRNGTFDELETVVDFLLASPGVTGQTISLAGGFGLATHRATPDSAPYFPDTW